MASRGGELEAQLDRTIDRLSGEFQDVLDREVVERETRVAFAALLKDVKITGFVPLLAGKVARRRLRELAEPGTPKA